MSGAERGMGARPTRVQVVHGGGVERPSPSSIGRAERGRCRFVEKRDADSMFSERTALEWPLAPTQRMNSRLGRLWVG